MCIVFPALILIHYALPLIALPFLATWRIDQAIAEEVRDIGGDLARVWRRDSALLSAAWKVMWRDPAA